MRSRKDRDYSFAAMLAVTSLLVAAVFVGNSWRALHPELQSVPRIDVRKVVARIEKAGLVPREASYYRTVPE